MDPSLVEPGFRRPGAGVPLGCGRPKPGARPLLSLRHAIERGRDAGVARRTREGAIPIILALDPFLVRLATDASRLCEESVVNRRRFAIGRSGDRSGRVPGLDRTQTEGNAGAGRAVPAKREKHRFRPSRNPAPISSACRSRTRRFFADACRLPPVRTSDIDASASVFGLDARRVRLQSWRAAAALRRPISKLMPSTKALITHSLRRAGASSPRLRRRPVLLREGLRRADDRRPARLGTTTATAPSASRARRRARARRRPAWLRASGRRVSEYVTTRVVEAGRRPADDEGSGTGSECRRTFG
jgi:hypothetical protein